MRPEEPRYLAYHHPVYGVVRLRIWAKVVQLPGGRRADLQHLLTHLGANGLEPVLLTAYQGHRYIR